MCRGPRGHFNTWGAGLTTSLTFSGQEENIEGEWVPYDSGYADLRDKNTPGPVRRHYDQSVTVGTSLLLPSHTAVIAQDGLPGNSSGDCENAVMAERHCLNSLAALVHSAYYEQGPLAEYNEKSYRRWGLCRKGTNDSDQMIGYFKDRPSCLGGDLVGWLFIEAKTLRLRSCGNPICTQRRQALEAAAPACGWPALRDLVVTTLGCGMPNFIYILESIIISVTHSGGRARRIEDRITQRQGSSFVFQSDYAAIPRGVSKAYVLGDIGKLPPRVCIDFIGVVDLCRWAMRIAYGGVFIEELHAHRLETNSYDPFGGLITELRSQHQKNTMSLTDDLQKAGICPNRLWNISLLSTHGMADIPHIALVAYEKASLPDIQRTLHAECTEQACLLAHQNSTIVVQAHKCSGGDCSELLYPPEALNNAFVLAKSNSQTNEPFLNERISGWTATAWRNSTTGFSLCAPNQKYLAISHVWSDGTGAGMKSPGLVNKCLASYFELIASEVGCDGLWWDAISIPNKRESRKIAINHMLRNYEAAAVTLVHDQELLDFTWRDDGSPAVALVLSSWFTRGWTAAELFASRGHPVKVLFGNPDDPNGRPVVKDLDDDVLAWEPGRLYNFDDDNEVLDGIGIDMRHNMLNKLGMVPTQSHFIATDIIRRLRAGTALRSLAQDLKSVKSSSISSLRDLLLVMRTRTCSWQRDRLLIPGLMCLPSFDVDSTATSPQISRQLLVHFGTILQGDIFHGEVPVKTFGPWSWCPPSIFDLGASYRSTGRQHNTLCHITHDGAIYVRFSVFSLIKGDVLVPIGTHPAVAARMPSDEEKKNYLLLTDSLQEHRQYILARPVWVGWSDNKLFISLRWIACVFLVRPEALGRDASDGPSHTYSIENKLSRIRKPEFYASDAPFFLFGRDVSGSGLPLPPMSVPSAMLAARAFGRARRYDQHVEWMLGMNYRSPKGHESWNLDDQPICVYPNGVAEEVSEEEAIVQPNCTATFLSNYPYNCVHPGVLDVIPEECLDTMQECDIDHVCGGTLEVTWSFPYMLISGVPTLRRLFRSTFHIMDEHIRPRQPGFKHEFTISGQTFTEDIGPYCIERVPNKNKEDERELLLTTCVSKDAADDVHWNAVEESRNAQQIDHQEVPEANDETTSIPEEAKSMKPRSKPLNRLKQFLGSRKA